MTDENETQVSEWPPHKYALRVLTESGELNYGATIEWERLEKLIDRGTRDGWPFRGEYMSLTDQFRKLGYIVTERGMNEKGIRVLTREEMAEDIKRRELNKANDSLRNSLTLSQVPRENLEKHEVAKLDHWENKAAVVGATAKVLLRKRKLPPPDAVSKSVKEIAKE